MARRSAATRGATVKRVAASALVAVVAVGVWWLGDGGSDAPDASRAVPTSDASAAAPAPAPGPGGGTDTAPDGSGLPVIDDDDLPPLAQETLDLIDAGGPFRCDKDDSAFGNYEGLLPSEAPGYYREYTVTAPGCPYRGALRIVEGANGESYWTDDHYESFELVLE